MAVRVLLDEQLPRQLVPYIVGHDVRTTQEPGWALQLVAALGAGCRTFLTNDRRLVTVPGLRVLQLSAYTTV